MTFSVPPGTFTMGTTDSKMDMALDDIIKERSKPPASGTSSSRPAKRQSLKTRRTQRASSVDKSIGRHKAKQQAAVNARRGLRSSAKPTKKEIDKEVSRQRSKSPLKKSQGGGRVKAGQSKRGKAKKAEAVQPPNRKAVAAARRAMAEAGFHAPPGMKMVVSFEPRSPIGTNTGSQTKKKGTASKTKARGGPRK